VSTWPTLSPRQIRLRSDDAASRWNFVAGSPRVVVEYRGGRSTAIDASGKTLLQSTDPFAALDFIDHFDLSSLPQARWVGYINYEFAREIETLPASTIDDLGLPMFWFALCEPASDVSFDAQPGTTALDARSMSRRHYLDVVARAIDYIAAGDIFQVNLAQRFTFRTTIAPADVFAALPNSPFGALLEFDAAAIISNSPELFFEVGPRGAARRIVNRPIKGTRPRLPGMREALEASAKDRAELAMIVDLQRNDLGRVCKIGSVNVAKAREIETHPTVYHGVATVEGLLRDDIGFAGIVRALFPCGSITGCPKIRAMQIIDELEPVARGPYCGAIGYIAADGSMQFNVAIRTITRVGELAHVSVGGGIVADSLPRAEYDETLVKARAMFDALGVPEDFRRSLVEG
jgi:anthranilate/para-aminobenzoate synthase component I